MAFDPLSATFSFSIFVFGVIMTYLTADQQSKLPDTCNLTTVQLGLNLILMLSIMMMIIPLIQLYCNEVCGCTQTNLGIGYRWIVLSILSLLIAASGTVLSGLTDASCKLDSLSSYMTYTLVVSSVFLVIIVVMMYVENNPGAFKSKPRQGRPRKQTQVGGSQSHSAPSSDLPEGGVWEE